LRVNYFNTFIAVAPDTSAMVGTVPVERAGKKSIALLEYELISAKPYTYTQEEVQFTVHVQRRAFPSAELKARRTELWQEFFSKSMACMRASPLPKSYGWGLHFNPEGKVALVAVESPEYKRLSSSRSVEQTRAMRGKRA
jgi:uncharacterized protein DUF6157